MLPAAGRRRPQLPCSPDEEAPATAAAAASGDLRPWPACRSTDCAVPGVGAIGARLTASIRPSSGWSLSGQMAHDTLRAARSRAIGSGSESRFLDECLCRTVTPCKQALAVTHAGLRLGSIDFKFLILCEIVEIVLYFVSSLNLLSCYIAATLQVVALNTSPIVPHHMDPS